MRVRPSTTRLPSKPVTTYGKMLLKRGPHELEAEIWLDWCFDNLAAPGSLMGGPGWYCAEIRATWRGQSITLTPKEESQAEVDFPPPSD